MREREERLNSKRIHFEDDDGSEEEGEEDEEDEEEEPEFLSTEEVSDLPCVAGSICSILASTKAVRGERSETDNKD